MPRSTHPLKAWRKAQIVPDEAGGCRRSMRLLDVERLYGIASSTWAGWEKYPDEPGFRRPDDANMKRLCTEITSGALSPNDFYPLAEWEADRFPAAAGAGG